MEDNNANNNDANNSNNNKYDETKKVTIWSQMAINSSLSETPLPTNELIRRSSFMLIANLTNLFGLAFSIVYKVLLKKSSASFYTATYFIIMTPCFVICLTASGDGSGDGDGDGSGDGDGDGDGDGTASGDRAGTRGGVGVGGITTNSISGSNNNHEIDNNSDAHAHDHDHDHSATTSTGIRRLTNCITKRYHHYRYRYYQYYNKKYSDYYSYYSHPHSFSMYHLIVNLHLLLILILPIGLQFELGGLVKSGGNMLGSFLSPMGASLFCKPRTAKKWFCAYFVLAVLTMSIEWVNNNNNKNSDKNSYDTLSSSSSSSSSIRPSLSTTQTIFFTVNICAALTITFIGILIFHQRLDTEYKKQEKLLHSVLPKSIARRLKQGESQIVENYKGVSILFADLVGFTTASTQLSSHFLIGMYLKDLFMAWDEICMYRSIENIKTIGDAFMAVGGIERKKGTSTSSSATPTEEEIEVAVQMVLLGLEMQEALDRINKKYQLEFKCRIGLHSGSVIAGVIGVRKFAFDVWGDAVNVASRMESHGLPGYIHISSDIYEQIKARLIHLNIVCRGDIEIKGKGKMTTYLIEMGERSGN